MLQEKRLFAYVDDLNSNGCGGIGGGGGGGIGGGGGGGSVPQDESKRDGLTLSLEYVQTIQYCTVNLICCENKTSLTLVPLCWAAIRIQCA